MGKVWLKHQTPHAFVLFFQVFKTELERRKGMSKNCQPVECRHSLDICSLLRELCKRTTCVWHVPNYLFVCQMNSLCCIFMIRYFYLILEEHLCLYDIFVKCHQCFSNQLLSNFVNAYNRNSCLSIIIVFNINNVTQTIATTKSQHLLYTNRIVFIQMG